MKVNDKVRVNVGSKSLGIRKGDVFKVLAVVERSDAATAVFMQHMRTGRTRCLYNRRTTSAMLTAVENNQGLWLHNGDPTRKVLVYVIGEYPAETRTPSPWREEGTP